MYYSVECLNYQEYNKIEKKYVSKLNLGLQIKTTVEC